MSNLKNVHYLFSSLFNAINLDTSYFYGTICSYYRLTENFMNKFNLYVWVGLAFNTALLGLLLYMLHVGELVIDGSDGAKNADLMRVLVIIACASFPVQLISLMIMSYKPRLAIGVAIISSLALMPITIVFVCGMIFSAIRWRYHQLATFDNTIKTDFDINLPYNNRHNTLRAIILGAVSVILIILSQSVGMFLLALAIILFYLGHRINGTLYVAVKDHYFYIRPSLFGLCYRIPLKDLTYQKNERNTVRFHLKTEQGIVQLPLSLLNLAPKDREKIALILERVPH